MSNIIRAVALTTIMFVTQNIFAQSEKISTLIPQSKEQLENAFNMEHMMPKLLKMIEKLQKTGDEYIDDNTLFNFKKFSIEGKGAIDPELLKKIYGVHTISFEGNCTFFMIGSKKYQITNVGGELHCVGL